MSKMASTIFPGIPATGLSILSAIGSLYVGARFIGRSRAKLSRDESRSYRHCFMMILSAFFEPLRSHFQRITHWMRAPYRLHYRSKRIAPTDKHNHHYSSQKTEWLKREIIRLKAHMPRAGCRTIADICNRRFAASRQITVGKTFVHETLQRHDYEVQILRRNLKQAKPKDVPRNLIWGLDLTGKTDSNGKLHALLGITDHGSRVLLHLQAMRDKTTGTLLTCVAEVV